MVMESLSFQFNGMLLVSPERRAPNSENKTFMLVELKVVGTWSKFFSSGSLGELVSVTIPHSIPWFLNLWILALGKTILHIKWWFKIHTTFCRTLPQFFRLLLPNWHHNCAFKKIFHLFFISLDASAWWVTWQDQWILWSWDHCCTSVGVGWVPW